MENKVKSSSSSLSLSMNNDIISRNKYYKLFFPFELVAKFITFGNRLPLQNRKIVFSYGEHTFTYNMSFADVNQFVIDTSARVPTQILFSGQMFEKCTIFNINNIKTRELVFDIDLTDYSDVRICCQEEKKCCALCWKFIQITVELFEYEFRNTFKFKHILWVYSGRRGVHCYVLDKSARKIDRDEIIKYLIRTFKSNGEIKVITNNNFDEDEYVKRSVKLYIKKFNDICFKDQNLFAHENGIQLLINSTTDDSLKERLHNELSPLVGEGLTSLSVFKIFRNILSSGGGDQTQYLKARILLAMKILAPRIDHQITLNLQHLLKSPFSIHPSTYNIAIPIQNVNDFDPTKDAIDSRTITDSDVRFKKAIEYFQEFITNFQNDPDEEIDDDDDDDEVEIEHSHMDHDDDNDDDNEDEGDGDEEDDISGDDCCGSNDSDY